MLFQAYPPEIIRNGLYFRLMAQPRKLNEKKCSTILANAKSAKALQPQEEVFNNLDSLKIDC